MEYAEKWHKKEQINSRKGMVTSLVIHGLLLLLLFLLTASTKQPEDQIQGVLIDFGDSRTGLGEKSTPRRMEEVNEVEPTETSESQSAAAAPVNPTVADEVVTQDFVEAPAVKPEKPKDPKPTAEEQAAAKKAAAEKAAAEKAAAEKAAAQAAAQQLKNQLDQAWSGDGNTKPGGDQGVKDGVENGPYNDGTSSTGLGDSGIGHDLSGRKMETRPTIKDTSQKTGKVAVRVRVDRSGKVIGAEYTSKGSTTTDTYLIALAVKAAKEAKFNSDPKAASEQIGTITFNFTVQ